mmetsp:Transcript_11262/g.20356  ORF Transcript_11262/g.20356 Transcript_11262/m.20356 type:complete len:83 (-) Transcript_11262:126-374(-)
MIERGVYELRTNETLEDDAIEMEFCWILLVIENRVYVKKETKRTKTDAESCFYQQSNHKLGTLRDEEQGKTKQRSIKADRVR